MFRKLIKKLFKIILNIFLKFNIIKINKKKILFISYPDLSDNSWYLFNYINRNRNNLELIWLLNENLNNNKKYITKLNKTNKVLLKKKV